MKHKISSFLSFFTFNCQKLLRQLLTNAFVSNEDKLFKKKMNSDSRKQSNLCVYVRGYFF